MPKTRVVQHHGTSAPCPRALRLNFQGISICCSEEDAEVPDHCLRPCTWRVNLPLTSSSDHDPAEISDLSPRRTAAASHEAHHRIKKTDPLPRRKTLPSEKPGNREPAETATDWYTGPPVEHPLICNQCSDERKQEPRTTPFNFFIDLRAPAPCS